MLERCGNCGAGGRFIVLAKPLTAKGRLRPRSVVLCRKCDAYDKWPTVIHAAKGNA